MREYIPKDWRCDVYRWKELRAFAMQYSRFRRERDDIRLEYRACMNGSISVKSSGGLTPVEQKADRLMLLDSNIELIEKCVRETVARKPYLYAAVLKAVTTDTPLYMIECDVGERQLSHYRQVFFFLLDQKRK